MLPFNTDYTVYPLYLKHHFTIARDSKVVVHNVFVRLSARGIAGYGEAAPNRRYNEDARKVVHFLKQLDSAFWERLKFPDQLPELLDAITPQVYSAKAAVETAYLDWWAKKQKKPLFALWGAKTNIGPRTSFTIGIDEPASIAEKVDEAIDFNLLKVKLSGKQRQDQRIIETIRQYTDKPLRVDINEGWHTLDAAKKGISYLADNNIELVEQPMPASCWHELRELHSYSPLKLCADESFTSRENIEDIKNAFDVINIKLMKSGSLLRSKSIIEEAERTGIEVMIGCMVESSLADTASAILALWVDYADLDGHLLISNDPFNGLHIDKQNRIHLPEQMNGIGARPVLDWLELKNQYPNLYSTP